MCASSIAAVMLSKCLPSMRMRSSRPPWRPVISSFHVPRAGPSSSTVTRSSRHWPSCSTPPWEVAPAQRLGVGRELGGELALGFGLGLEKGAPRRHRCGDAVVVLAVEADEVEQVALAARCFVLPCPARGGQRARWSSSIRCRSGQ